MNKNALNNKLKAKNIILVTPENENVLGDGMIGQILNALHGVAVKYSNESFNMMPNLQNIVLSSKKIVDAVAVADFIKGEVCLYGIYLYDKSLVSYEEVKGILQNHFKPQFLN